MIKKLILLLGIIGLVYSQPFEYVGWKKCGMCHKKDEQGAQLGVWEGSQHSKAFETLKGEKAIAIAKEKGLTASPWEAPECVKCHTTGYGNGGFEIKDEAFWNPADDDRDGKKAAKLMEYLKGVGCEGCHGPGSEYKSKKTMKAIYAGEVDGATVGFHLPNEETCRSCHNEESPTFTSFDFEEYFSKIAHKFPEGYSPK